VLINCGGSLDIIDILEPEEDITFFVIDSHRPTDICNVYSSSQVTITTLCQLNSFIPIFFIFQIRILATPEEDEKIPEYDDIFIDEEVK